MSRTFMKLKRNIPSIEEKGEDAITQRRNDYRLSKGKVIQSWFLQKQADLLHVCSLVKPLLPLQKASKSDHTA